MNRAIPDEILDQVRIRADIVDVIQSYLPLKRAGQSFKACCPFHQEKTPSFTVNPARQTFHCFGCGKGGDVFRFVMERENVDFPNAIHILASKYGIDIPEENERRRPGSPPPKPEERRDFKERLYSLHEKIQAWFASNLAKQELPVSKYLQTRGLPEESIKKFGIGASLDSWDAGAIWARREGFSDQELTAGGLLVESSEHPGRFYDRFRNRLMFPIWNEQGRVVGFSARTIESNPQGGKYVNSPETPVFKKSRVLYGLHLAREKIGQSKFAILCEGQLDVIAMHRAGFSNSIAPQGTAFTEEQASMLKRYTDTLLLALDSDAAGQKAILRCAELALPAGFELKVVQFPSGKDPDELLKTSGAEAIAQAVNSAIDFFEFLFAKTAAEKDLATPSGKAEAAAELVRFVGLMESELSRASYLDWLAKKIGMDQAALQAGMTKALAPSPYKRNKIRELAQEAALKNAESEKKSKNDRRAKAVEALFECVLLDKEAASKAAGELGDALFTEADGPVGKALETVLQASINGEWEDAPRRIMAALDQAQDCSKVTALLTAEPTPKSKKILDDTLEDCVQTLRFEDLTAKEIEKKKELFALSPESSEYQNVLIELTKLQRQKLLLVNPRKGKKSTKLPAEVGAPKEKLDEAFKNIAAQTPPQEAAGTPPSPPSEEQERPKQPQEIAQVPPPEDIPEEIVFEENAEGFSEDDLRG